jgi:hypothetical protein
MEPESKGSSIFKHRSKVDFPEPLFPIMPSIDVELMEKNNGPKVKEVEGFPEVRVRLSPVTLNSIK